MLTQLTERRTAPFPSLASETRDEPLTPLELDALLLGAVERALDLPHKPVRGGLPAWRLRRVARHVEAHIASRLDVRALAQIAQMSPSHFGRAFRETAGVTPHAYVLKRRVERAYDLIADGDCPLAEVASACGMADQSHMSRVFARRFGLAPGALRRALRADGPGVSVGPARTTAKEE